ncbi:MAG: carbohydrate-binding domain-containing protein [Lachnospiraceae bacterium]|nr:carbohydrate-binding domain-containing protein [Lachnospiraceae bacterium]
MFRKEVRRKLAKGLALALTFSFVTGGTPLGAMAANDTEGTVESGDAVSNESEPESGTETETDGSGTEYGEDSSSKDTQTEPDNNEDSSSEQNESDATAESSTYDNSEDSASYTDESIADSEDELLYYENADSDNTVYTEESLDEAEEADEVINSEEVTGSASSNSTDNVEDTLSADADTEELSAEGSLDGVTISLTEDSSGTAITYSDTEAITVNPGSGMQEININKSGAYTLTGEGSNVYVSIGEKIGSVSLTIKDLKLKDSGLSSVDGGNTSVIFCDKKNDLKIIMEGDSTIEAPAEVFEDGENEAEAVISQKKKSTLTFSGDGSLTISNSLGDAIKSKGTVTVESGNIEIKGCEGDGIQAENVNISGGEVDIETVYDKAGTGYYTNSASSETLNTLVENGNTKTERINVDTGSHKGIKAGTKAKIEIYEAVREGDLDDDDNQLIAKQEYATEASGGLTITGGTVKIDTTKSGLKANSITSGSYTPCGTGVYIIGSPDDALQSNNDMEISGGTLLINSSDDGITAAGKLTITGSADIDIETAYEGMEAKEIIIGEEGKEGPDIYINSNDDGINTAYKTLTYTYDSSADTDCNYTKVSTSKQSGSDCSILSGRVEIRIDSENTKTASLTNDGESVDVSYKSSGDGIDCNGALAIEDGEVYVYGQSNGDNSPVDTNDGFTLNNAATLLLTGTDGMGESVPKSGSSVYVVYGNTGNGAPANNGQGNGNAGSNSGNSGSNMASIAETADSGELPSDGRPGKNGGFSGAPGNGGTPGGTAPGSGGNSGMPGGGSLPGGMSAIAAGSKMEVLNGSDTIYSTTLPFAASFLLYASPELADGESYTIAINGTNYGQTGLNPGESMPGMGEPPQNGQTAPESKEEELKEENLTLGVKDASGVPVSINVIVSRSVSYNGKKHLVESDAVKAAAANDIRLSVSTNIAGFSKIKYIVKNAKNANSNTGSKKAPRIILQFKPNGATAEQKKILSAVNRELKKNPIYFDIEPIDLSEAQPTVELNSSGTKIKKVTVTVDGRTIKLKKKDYTANGVESITGKGNFTGTWNLNGENLNSDSADTDTEGQDGTAAPTAPPTDSNGTTPPTPPSDSNGTTPPTPPSDSNGTTAPTPPSDSNGTTTATVPENS